MILRFAALSLFLISGKLNSSAGFNTTLLSTTVSKFFILIDQILKEILAI
ncbi:hypothetical protein GPB2148_2172 [marine gamma proteobacterium HTCC2148]|nr:hypothetical protein GPB2148_2172 [marine gamma proteobacterium HTCC2148]